MAQEKEESIDLGRFLRILWDRRIVVGGIVLLCTIIATIVAFVLPKQYASTTLVQMRSTGSGMGTHGNAAALASMAGIDLGGSSGSASPTNYIELMKSRRVLEPIIDAMDWPSDKKKPTAADFAKSNLDIKNTKQTNLISVTAKGRTPEEAQMISQGVVDNFLAMQTDMNQQTQSLLVQFLDDRIKKAKDDSEKADAALAKYSRENKIYSPEEQIKAAVQLLGTYDEEFSKQEVDYQSADAELASLKEKIGEQEQGALAYNINDNDVVTKIRNEIVTKEVALVELRQKYTDKHPEVIAAKESLAKLRQSLQDEVGAIVASKAATLNPTQAELMTKAAQASAKRAVAAAAKSAVEKERSKQDAKMENVPDSVMTYLQLKSDAKIKGEVYTNLVQQRENKSIQEAMESMDIQVVDEADLPDADKPTAPHKKLIIVLGFVFGCFLTFTYGILCYRRFEN
ncbi:GumC family protein [Mitsuokella sp. oral taxon 131]|uniref:GumC family protein n=1 Tax=Mitsuokella sp. oral taxon 131 TaxID=1321780 RepID=UPI0003FACC82|nr:GumC family protein [Mitsuokella sp. oral taxon 131]